MTIEVDKGPNSQKPSAGDNPYGNARVPTPTAPSVTTPTDGSSSGSNATADNASVEASAAEEARKAAEARAVAKRKRADANRAAAAVKEQRERRDQAKDPEQPASQVVQEPKQQQGQKPEKKRPVEEVRQEAGGYEDVSSASNPAMKDPSLEGKKNTPFVSGIPGSKRTHGAPEPEILSDVPQQGRPAPIDPEVISDNTPIEELISGQDYTDGARAQSSNRGQQSQNNQNTTNRSRNTYRDARDAAYRRHYKIPKEVEEQGDQAIMDYIINQARRSSYKQVNEKYSSRQTSMHGGDSLPSFDEQDEGATPVVENLDTNSRIERMEHAIKSTQEMFMFPFLHVEGAHVKQGKNKSFYKIELPLEVQNALGIVMNSYNVSVNEAMQMVILRLGLAPDTFNKIAGEKKEDFKIPPHIIKTAVSEILLSQEQSGHPFALLKDRPPMVFMGTYCYPMAIVPTTLQVAMTQPRSVLADTTFTELNRNLFKTWVNDTYPTMEFNCTGDRIKQKLSIDNMARAMLAIDGKYTSKLLEDWKIPELEKQTMADYYRDLEAAQKHGDSTDVAVVEHRYQEQDRAQAVLKSKMLKRNKQTNKWEKKQGNAYNLLTMMSNLERFAGVALNPPLMISNYAEHVLGTVDARLANLWLSHGDENFRMTGKLRELIRTQEAAEALSAIQVLFSIGDVEALQSFELSKKPLTVDGVNAWFNEIWQRDHVGKLESAANKLRKWTDTLMTGSMDALRKYDATEMVQMFLINQANLAKQGDTTAITADMLYDMMKSGGLSQTFTTMVSTKAGIDAYISSTNLNMGRVNPWSHAVHVMLREHGVTNFTVTTFIEKYLEYNINFAQVFLPLSNTMSYLAVTLGTKVSPGGYGKANWADEMVRYQMGGADMLDGRFLDGLKKNMIYDCVKFGQTATIGLIWFAFIQLMGGIDDPEKEGDIFDWIEYPIKGLGRVVPAWWLNDLSCWGLPFGMALAVAAKHPDDPSRAFGVFCSGSISMMDGSTFMDILTMISHPDDVFRELDEMQQNPNLTPGERNMLMIQLATERAFAGVDNFVPGVIKNYLWPGNVKDSTIVGVQPAHSAYKLYNKEKYGDQAIAEERQINNEDMVDIYRRKLAQNRPLYAMLMNLIHNTGYDSQNKTGYLYSEQPLALMADPTAMAWLSVAEFDPENDDPIVKAQDLLDTIQQQGWKSAAEAKQNGFYLSPDARINLGKYLTKEYRDSWDAYWAKKNNGEFSSKDEKDNAYKDASDLAEKNKAFIEEWITGDTLPWRSDHYVKLESDYKKEYYDSEGNRVANWNYLNRSDVHAKYVPRGNHPSSLAPFTVVDTKDRGFNAETINSWYDPEHPEKSNLAQIAEFGDGVQLKYGRDQGGYLDNVIFGNDGTKEVLDDQNAELLHSDQPTINYRSYIELDKVLPSRVSEELKEYSKSLDSQSEEDKNKNLQSQWPSSYPYYSRGGTGSSNYSPKIYSNPRSVNAKSPATMQTSRPYHRNTTYIRPSFETKGSREAYKRGDI